MNKLVCIVCPNGCGLEVTPDGAGGYYVSGNKCPRGNAFAITEMTAPTRSLTTSVKTVFKEMPVVSVRTKGEIPKGKIKDAMKEINACLITEPKRPGDTVINNVASSGVDVIITTDMTRIVK